MSLPPAPFRVGLTADFYDAAGALKYPDIGLGMFEKTPGVEVTAFAEHRPVIGADQIEPFHGVIVLTPRVTAETLKHADHFLAFGRFGVGYDSVDVKACTEADVALFITPGAVNRPVAEATVMWMLALSHHLQVKDRLVRTGEWDARSRYMGTELRDRTLGIIGFGGIGRELMRLVSGFGMNPPLVFDPFQKSEVIQESGAVPVSLERLLAESDFVSLHCPLTEQTRNLIGAREIGQMKRTAYLINTARGGIVEETALYEALKSRRIAGAALDCFVQEPITSPPIWADLENVLLAPHSIAWTKELFRDIGRSVCQGMLDLVQGKQPAGIVNPEVFHRPGFLAKWKPLVRMI